MSLLAESILLTAIVLIVGPFILRWLQRFVYVKAPAPDEEPDEEEQQEDSES